MKITEEMIDYISALSRLKPAPEEKARLIAELEQFVSCIDVLNTLDTEGVEPLSHVLPLKNITRPDVIAPSFPRENLLRSSPDGNAEAFLVPKAVEG